jgi:hypothetical protein
VVVFFFAVEPAFLVAMNFPPYSEIMRLVYHNSLVFNIVPSVWYIAMLIIQCSCTVLSYGLFRASLLPQATLKQKKLYVVGV